MKIILFKRCLIGIISLVVTGCAPGSTTGSSEPSVLGLYRVDREALTRSSEGDISRMLLVTVVRSIDGDTVRVQISNPPPDLKPEETIRMIGVDTPETVHPDKPVQDFGPEASAFTKAQLLDKQVYLAFDWDLRDRYDRLLGYIYTEDGACFNARLIQEGYAYAYLYFPFQFMEEFTDLEQTAQEQQRGLWGLSQSGLNLGKKYLYKDFSLGKKYPEETKARVI
ncbi:MAG: thermonuclease family protein [Treponema sp.]|jgi:micrococcal nuclease|nr:thermonuclease family protein [Treponema sp.]